MLCSFKLLFTQSRFMSLQKKYAESIKSRSISCLWFMDFIRKHCKCLFAIFNIAHITKLLLTTTHFSHFVWNQILNSLPGKYECYQSRHITLHSRPSTILQPTHDTMDLLLSIRLLIFKTFDENVVNPIIILALLNEAKLLKISKAHTICIGWTGFYYYYCCTINRTERNVYHRKSMKLRVSYTQPRIYYWNASYTVSTTLLVSCAFFLHHA